MPVVDFPDVSRHRYCFRCGKWFEPADGTTFRTELWRPMDKVRAATGMQTANTDVFICHPCKRTRTAVKVILCALFFIAAMAGAVWLLVGDVLD